VTARGAREPRNHWILLLLLAVAGFGALALEGFGAGSKAVAEPGEPPPRAVAEGGPVIDTAGERPESARVPRRTVALTFDGGPDPAWTPALLDVLRRHGVKATFFAGGARAAEYPDLTRRLVGEGHELGSNAYSYAGDLGAMSPSETELQLDMTQHVLAGTVGAHTRLVRPPNVRRPDGLHGERWRAAREIGRRGNLVVLSDLNGADAQNPSPSGIAAAVTPRRGRGAVVSLPSSGGDRAATVEATDRLLSSLDRRGYRVTTVSRALDLGPAAVPASTWDKTMGRAVVLAQRGANLLTLSLTALLGIAGVLTTGRVLLLIVLARVHIFRLWRTRNRREWARWKRSEARRKRRWPTRNYPPPMMTPGVSVIVPVHNEEAGVEATVMSLVDTGYEGPLEIIVVDDGSTDGTAEVVESLGLPEVRLIRRPNGGKHAALNTGVAHATAEILIFVDGDTVFRPDTIGLLVAPLNDPSVGAVSGNTKVANRSGLLCRWQHVEYVMGFNLDRRMYDVLKCMPTVPGAIGAFRHTAVEEAGGLQGDTLAEDTDLTIAICRAGWRIVYEERAVAWTEVPSTLRQFWRQRYRWCYGTMQAMWKHRRSVLDRGSSGRFGRRGLPYLVLYHLLLPLFAPAVDILALYGLFVFEPWKIITLWLGFSAVQMFAARSALWMDGESTRPVWTLPLQQFVYRQLLYLVAVQSVITMLLGARLRWQPMRRDGVFAGVVTGPAAPEPADPRGVP
jgi:cellulose synthase/poly-beta-1,6-N-acetylglucosamine synthase-like glycosyltransferase/peptidoglycan/xylan/chitin deacetylase (PgdA/CDA1 family)